MPKRSTLRLTTRSVSALPATGRDTVHWDRDLAGFGVRVQHNGRKVSTAAGLCARAAAQKCTTGIGGSLSP